MAKGNHLAKGRPPSPAPRTIHVTIKMTEAEKRRLDVTAEILGTTKTKVLIEGLNRMMNEAAAIEKKRQDSDPGFMKPIGWI